MPMVYSFNVFTNRLDISEIDILPPGDLESLEGDAGGPVGPDAAHNLFIIGGTGVNVVGTPATNTLTINAIGGGLTWNTVAGTTQAMAAHNGYITSNVALTTFTLPATGTVGDVTEIIGKGSGGWRIAQNALQSVQYGNMVTTVGVGGYIDSTNRYDTIQLTCTTTDTVWTVTKSIGVVDIN